MLFALLTAMLLAPAVPAAEPGPNYRRPPVVAEDASNARVIVKYRADGALMRALAAREGTNARPLAAGSLSMRLSVPLTDGRVLGARTQALRGVGLSSSQLAARLEAQPDVEWAVPDRRRHLAALTNDPYLRGGQTDVTPAAGQWYLRAPDSTLVSAINAVGAWDVSTGSPGLTVAVLDTGVRFDHPDLAAKLYPGYDFVHDSPTANDGGGRDGDASDPGDWTNAGECTAGEPAYPSSWHGTQVAGLVGAASDNGIGVAGAGRNVMLLPVRVLGRCGGYDSDIIAALRWAAGLSSDPVTNAHPARVINMSLGSGGACDASYRDVLAELDAAGVAVVVASGNDAGLAVNAPANCPGAIAVAGVRHIGTKVGYSNVGPEVAIAAPAGNCVNLSGTCLYPLMTTTNTGATSPGANVYSDGTNYSVGTSFATPLVAGTVALMMSLDPTLTPAKVRAALQASARPFPTGGAATGTPACHAPGTAEQIECYCTTTTCGAGMLDAAAAVNQVRTAAAGAPTAQIGISPSNPTAGTGVTLTSTGSAAHDGRSIAAYQWSITGGSGIAVFGGPANEASALLQTSGAGTVTVQLTITDTAGNVGTASASITVAAAPVTVSSGGGGSGGGAVNPGWLLGLALAVLALRRRRAG